MDEDDMTKETLDFGLQTLDSDSEAASEGQSPKSKAQSPDLVPGSSESSATIGWSLEVLETPKPLAQVEIEHILATIQFTEGNKNRAAKILGIDRRTLYRKLDRHRAQKPLYEPRPKGRRERRKSS